MIDIDNSFVLTEMDLVENHAKSINKCLVHLRADGPKEYIDKAEEVWEFYEGKVDDNVRHLLMQLGEVYVKFESADQARDCIERWFPMKQVLDDEEYELGPEYYIYAYGVNENGVGFLHN